jgi:hypothetical protein
LSAPALYARAEASRHRRLARSNQKFALDIEAIGPFIANLDKSEQDGIRKDLVARMFAQPEIDPRAKPDGVESESLLEMMSRMLGLLEKRE